MSNKVNLEQLHRLSKFARHLSGFFHNMNTPLMGISGRLELLSFTQPDLKGLAQMTTQVEALEAIMNNYSKILANDKKDEKSNIDLAEMISDIDTFYKTNLKYKHKLNTSIEIEPKTYIEVQINHFQNLITNAINLFLELVQENSDFTIQADSNEIRFISNDTSVDDEFITKFNDSDYKDFENNETVFFMKYYEKLLKKSSLLTKESDSLILKINL